MGRKRGVRVPGSRRDRRQRKKEDEQKRYRASVEPIRDFSETHTGDAELVRVVEQGFRECGEVILGYLLSLHGGDSGNVTAAVQQGKTLVQMGLVSPEMFASSFGGAMNVVKSLGELRVLARQAGINAYSTTTVHGERKNLTIEALREACVPLVYMSPSVYKLTRVRGADNILQRLRDLECLPGRDERVERELNRRIIAYHPRTRPSQTLPATYLHSTLTLPERLFVGVDPSQIPIAYRAGLAKHASDLWRDWKKLPRISDEYALETSELVKMHIRAEEAIRRDIV